MLSIMVPILCLAGLFYLINKPVAVLHDDELVVGTSANFPPFEFIKDGSIVGFEIDLINAVAEKLGKKAVFKDLAFDMLLLEAQAGRIQIIASGMTPTEERAKQILFTKPYVGLDDPLVAVTSKTDVITKLEDLYDKEVIVNDGYTAEKQMKKHPNIKVKTIPTVSDAFLSLNNKRAFAFVTAQNTLAPFFEKYGKEHYNIFKLDFIEPSAIGVSKAHASLLEPIQKVLDELQIDGTLQKLKEKWNIK